ncbi:MAG: glycoside hydrolase family 2, partial [Planctomycetales bacterium]|nr:glycoside hydrolase family 2 [Planctomycetales bacterium]
MPRLFLRCVATLTVAQSLLCGTATQYSHGEETTFVEPTWRYVTQPPSDTWFQTQFDDSKWQQGLGGFGDPETPGARVGTNWSTNDIWLRREFEMSSVPAKVGLLLHHDEDVEVYINGAKVKSLDGYTTEYQTLPLDDNARGVLKPGKNTLAVHCHQTGGGQFIDVHVVDTENAIKLPQPPRPTTPFKSELITRWGAEVTADNAWREYPRPQMVRSNWQNLNGMWDYAVAPKNESSIPTPWDGKILVPFCLESKLSGVQRLLDPDEALWYHRTFSATKDRTQRSLLNFEAVDYACRVWVNGHQVGSHQGGNVPFQLDITDVLVEGSNELIVRVDDATEQMQLRGKQTLKPRGIWYTQVSGIWQTVWLEQVPLAYLQNVKISTDAKAGTISLRGLVSDEDANRGDYQLKVVALDGDRQVAEAVGPIADVTLAIADAKKWSPSSPHLYDLTITLVSKEGQALDEIKSYAGIRDVGKVQDENGHWRFTLNGNILFHWGTLDQGWWPDGLLTPPSDAGMAYDVQFLKDAGFNMIRK